MIGEQVVILKAFGIIERLEGVITEENGDEITVASKRFGHRKWSPEYGGYRESEAVEQGVRLLASRGIMVPAAIASLIEYKQGMSTECIALEILVLIVSDLLERRI